MLEHCSNRELTEQNIIYNPVFRRWDEINVSLENSRKQKNNCVATLYLMEMDEIHSADNEQWCLIG